MNESIARMTDEIVTILDQRVHSVWLYGSVVLNDFRPGWSDIDILVLTEQRITEEQAQALLLLRQAMTSKDPDNPYYRLFEGIVANLDEYRTGRFSRLVYWGTTGQRVTGRCERDVFAAYELARYGQSVYGQADRSIFALPGREEMVRALQAHYDAIRTYAVRTDERLYSCGWLLDIARCVYTLRNNDVISKTEAGLWALRERIFPDEDALKKTLEIRQHPLEYRDQDDVKRWLAGLGPTVQRYADVLEKELVAQMKSTEREGSAS